MVAVVAFEFSVMRYQPLRRALTAIKEAAIQAALFCYKANSNMRLTNTIKPR